MPPIHAGASADAPATTELVAKLRELKSLIEAMNSRVGNRPAALQAISEALNLAAAPSGPCEAPVDHTGSIGPWWPRRPRTLPL